MDQKSKGPQTVIERYNHHAFFRQIRAMVFRPRSGAERKPAAVNPDHHGQFFTRIFCGRPDIEIQTVLAEFVRINPSRLWTGPAEIPACSDFIPGSGFLRRLPAQCSDRRSGIRNALEHTQTAFLRSDNRTAGHSYDPADPMFFGTFCIAGLAGQDQRQTAQNHFF